MDNAAINVRPPRPQSIRKRADIIAGAKAVFLEQGFSSASMDVISERSNVSKRTIYKHFESKYELFSAVIRMLCADVLPPEEEFDAYKNRPIDEVLYSLAVQFLRQIFSPDHLELFRTVISEIRQFPELGPIFIDSAVAATANRVEEYFMFLAHKGDLQFERQEYAAAQFIGSLKGDIQLRLLFKKRKRISDSEIDERARSAVNLFLLGALPRK